MRELKFRARYKDVSWVYFDLSIGFTDEGYSIYKELLKDKVQFYQYTGLKDKNGKEIFEGDIVRGEYREYKIEWLDDCFGYKLIATDGSTPTRIPIYENIKKIEIIGNIYENPDLLPKE